MSIKSNSAIFTLAKKCYRFFFVLKSWLFYNIYNLQKVFVSSRSNKNKPIWIIGERNGFYAGDNGFVLFCYLQKHHVDEIESYFVIRKSASEYKRLKNKSSILVYNSKKHLNIFSKSDVILFTDKLKDVCDNQYLINSIVSNVDIKFRTFVMLHHGVMYLKSTSFKNYHKDNFNIPLDVFVANSDYEKNNLVKHSGYTNNQIAVTGFPRFDLLLPHKHKKKYILFMPTWRRGMKYWHESDFVSSYYYKRIQSVLTHNELIEILKLNGLCLKFYVHFNMHQWIRLFESQSEFVQIESPVKTDVTQLLNNSAMLITDFSTISFDVIYMDKPVVFYDLGMETEDELGQSPISANFENEIFGTVLKDEKALIDEIFINIKNDFNVRSRYLARRELFFKFIDSNNSSRVVDHVRQISDAKLNPQLDAPEA